MIENQLIKYIKAKRPILYINHYDYKEIDSMIISAIKDIENLKIYEYRSIGEVDFVNKKILEDETQNLFQFIKNHYVEGMFEKVFLILKDVDDELENPKVLAMLRKISEMTVYNQEYNLTIIIVSQKVQVPIYLENYISIVEIPKLENNEIKKYIQKVAKEKNLEVIQEDLGEISVLLKGLSKWNITQILNTLEDISASTFNIQRIIEEKGQIIKKSGILELINFNEKLSDIGGLENLKNWLENKAKIFRKLDEAKEFGVNIPKGLLLVGMPGCGKSLTAKVASRMFNVPLLRLDIGRIFGKYVGESENNLRMALKISESISPCILWIDEIEKAFAGIKENSGASDITKRLFGQFLTWLQEKKNPVFVVATANNISLLPPEFLRKGRFNEVFYIDLPTQEEREEIFKIHLEKKRKYNEELINIKKIADITEGFCGADIEETVNNAIETLFLKESKNKFLTTNDILTEISKITPIKASMQEKIENLVQEYKNYNLKSASSKKENTKKDRDMIFVKGGKYKMTPSDEEKTVSDLLVSKYQVTGKKWRNIMTNDSFFPTFTLTANCDEDKKPVTNVSWLEALTYCNKLSEYYGLKPVYRIENNRLIAIVYSDGEEIHPNLADYSKTEGYRLPTVTEWRWFASGGEIAIQDGTFNTDYSGSDDIEEVAWYFKNSDYVVHDVGTKKANELGLYDCTGNVWEWCFDKFTFNKFKIGVVIGGAYSEEEDICKIDYFDTGDEEYFDNSGIRVVRNI